MLATAVNVVLYSSPNTAHPQDRHILQETSYHSKIRPISNTCNNSNILQENAFSDQDLRGHKLLHRRICTLSELKNSLTRGRQKECRNYGLSPSGSTMQVRLFMAASAHFIWEWTRSPGEIATKFTLVFSQRDPPPLRYKVVSQPYTSTTLHQPDWILW